MKIPSKRKLAFAAVLLQSALKKTYNIPKRNKSLRDSYLKLISKNLKRSSKK